MPTYLRGAMRLSEQDVKSISSKELAALLGVNPWQIRKDFSYFGEFGTPGVGYNIEKLLTHIRKILKLDVVRKAALVGAGNLGSALLAFPRFGTYSLEIAAAFDIDKRKIGKKKHGVLIENISAIKTLGQRSIDLGIISVPRGAAQEIADKLVEAGIRGILNLSPQHVTVPKNVKVITIDIAKGLARLPYYV